MHNGYSKYLNHVETNRVIGVIDKKEPMFFVTIFYFHQLVLALNYQVK